MKMEFVGQSTRDSTNVKGTTGRLVNFYREPNLNGGYTLRSVLGQSLLVDLNRAWTRAMMPMDDNLLVVAGGALFKVAADGGTVNAGSVGESEETAIATNTGYATVVAGGGYWTYDGTTLTSVVAGVLESCGSVAGMGGYTIISEKGGRRFVWSDLADPTSMPALNFASAEINDDDIIRLATVGDTLVIFKASGIERWAITGQAGPEAFARISGAMIETGLRAFGLFTTYPNGLAFCGTDGRVHAWNGAALTPISTPAVEVALTNKTPNRMFYYERRGHGFICLQFRDAPAWCYDIATGEWHERAESGGAWSATIATKFNGAWYVGSEIGRISVLTSTCRDFDAALIRKATSRTLDVDRMVTIAMIEAFARVGQDTQNEVNTRLEDTEGYLSPPMGISGDDGPAILTLRTSRDGFNFGPEKPRDLGAPGQYSKRMVWRSLGQFRRATVELTLSCRDDVPISAELQVVAQ